MIKEIKEVLEEYKKHTDYKIEEVKKHFDVLKEDIDGKFDLIIEGHESHDKKFDLIEAKLDSHTEMIGSMQVNLEIIKNDIEIIKTSLRKKVDLEDFEVLERRVKILEAKITK
jgi:DNA-binding transcriptional MerR regulator